MVGGREMHSSLKLHEGQRSLSWAQGKGIRVTRTSRACAVTSRSPSSRDGLGAPDLVVNLKVVLDGNSESTMQTDSSLSAGWLLGTY